MAQAKSEIIYTGSAYDFMRDYKLVIQEAFLLGRLGVSRVMQQGVPPTQAETYVLKTGKLSQQQIDLLTLADRVDFANGVRLPKVHTIGTLLPNAEDSETSDNRWIMLEDVKGRKEVDLIDSEPQFCIDQNWEIAQGYQKLLAIYRAERAPTIDYESARTWLRARIPAWSEKIVAKGLITTADVDTISHIWEELIIQHGNNLVAIIHGNIHGDHVIFPEHGPGVLLDPVMWVRPGRSEYYDWLRSLDWMILKARDPQQMPALVLQNIRKRLPHVDEKELKAFFALRGLGCLGADILSNMDTPPAGAERDRQECFVQLIKGNYQFA